MDDDVALVEHEDIGHFIGDDLGSLGVRCLPRRRFHFGAALLEQAVDLRIGVITVIACAVCSELQITGAVWVGKAKSAD